jgi:opacity protein-like surface antigen
VAFDRVLLYGAADVGLAYLEAGGTVTSPDKWAYGLTFGAGPKSRDLRHR